MKKDIGNWDDVKLMVDEFYGKVRNNSLLAPIFFERIEGSWDAHLNKMYLFWNTILFAEGGYSGNPFAKHADMPIEEEHFDQWLVLFQETVKENFEGPVADEAQWRAGIIANTFLRRLRAINGNPNQVVL